jgi:chromosome segregation ATPase
MKPTFRAIIVIAVIALAACARPIEHKDQTAERARDTSSSLRAVEDQIDNTLAALNNLLSAQPADLKTAYDQYSKEVDKMHALARRTDLEAQATERKSRAYLDDWEKNHAKIENQELRQASLQRRTEVMSHFDRVQTSYTDARNGLRDFLRNLDDIRTALANDLTPNGITAIKATEVVKNATDNGSLVKTRLAKVDSELVALADSLQPVPPTQTGTSNGQTSSSTNSGQTSSSNTNSKQ